MKKSFLMLALLGGTATAAQAQTAIPAGTISLGGGIGYSSHTTKEAATSSSGTAYSEEVTTSQFNFSPSVGYFIADNLAIGLQFGYFAMGKPKTTETPAPAVVLADLDAATTIKVGPYAQYYKMLSDQFGIVGTLGLGYQSNSDSEYGEDPTGKDVVQVTKGSGLYADLTPGVVFFPVPKFGISASIGGLGYSSMSYDYKTNDGPAPSGYESKSSDFGLRFGLDQLNFGGTFYFGR